MRRPGAWLKMFFNLHFDSVQFMCRRTGNEEHPVRIMFDVHSFCSCFIWSLHTTSDSSRSEFVTCIT